MSGGWERYLQARKCRPGREEGQRACPAQAPAANLASWTVLISFDQGSQRNEKIAQDSQRKRGRGRCSSNTIKKNSSIRIVTPDFICFETSSQIGCIRIVLASGFHLKGAQYGVGADVGSITR